jgi:hypothetical protein
MGRVVDALLSGGFPSRGVVMEPWTRIGPVLTIRNRCPPLKNIDSPLLRCGTTMNDLKDPIYAQRLLIALDLAESGIQMRRAQLERRYPDESKEEIKERLKAWLLTRPGAEGGDAQGRIVDPSRLGLS